MSNVTAYYRLAVLPQAVRLLNGFKSPNRFDCVATHNPDGYGLLTLFENKKGMLPLYIIPSREMVKASSRRRANYNLGDGKQNLTSLFFEHPDQNSHFYGYCNGKEKLSDGTPNRAVSYRHDGFLIVCDWQQQVIELMVIQGGKPMIENLYCLLIDGEFTGELERLRQTATPYYPYKMP